MKAIYVSATVLALCVASVYGQGKDPLTGLPVIPAAETIVQGKSLGLEPSDLPPSALCKSKMKGDFYTLSSMDAIAKTIKTVKVSSVVAWYAAHLSGFKKSQGYAGGRSQIAFYKSDGTIVVWITGNNGRQAEDADAYSVSYQRYDPGLSERTIVSLTQGKTVCQ
jgi:hypothetical protein